ncbi:MurNAc alpha-1-phosphate uridylyltransferase [Rhizomicrobium palustre]|uniref:MurNAc alpha-1-phosphate uridylyltransferase n=1 Tax=Rhizomicrobium palustre TaxID=189966 RepID=A0A846N4N9_9PROT|nr:nucleotidyltransferase family protein [Rhizomicrobium palustre]NIK90489.1 MurNAc alpha-1-phosphate uridylyltransferase [Rhizomicrobium palustre]
MRYPKRAMIMAAGLGTRMRPLTETRPKPLVQVQGKALIDHAIDRLKDAGVTTFVVNLYYKGEMIREHLAGRKDVEILYSDESDGLLGTGGGVLKAMQLLGDEPFYVHNSDSIWVEGYGKALEQMKVQWDAERMDALLLMVPLLNSIGYEGRGDFMMDGVGHLSRVPPGRVSPFAYPGVQIVHPRLFDNPPEGVFSTNILWDRSIEKERLFGVRMDGVWIHVGTPQAVADAEEFLNDLAPAA